MSSTPASSRLFALLTFIVVAVYLFLTYRNIVIFDYPAAPGGDLVNHYITYQNLISQGVSVINIGYPQLFHVAILGITSITGLSFYSAVLWIFPIIPVAGALIIGHYARNTANPLAGFLATTIFLFAATQPHQTLLDGGYPNFIASTILLPLTLLSLSKALDLARLRYWITTGILALVLFSTHHLTSVYLVVISAFILLPHVNWRKLSTWAYTVVLILGVYLVAGVPLRLITEVSIRYSSNFPWLAFKGGLDNPNAIWNLSDYPVGIGYLPFTIGIFALALAFVNNLKHKARTIESVLIIWALVLLITSQIPELVFPVRLARDAAVPLVILTAVTIAKILTETRNNWYKYTILLAVLLIARPHILETFSRLTSYNEHIQYSNAIQQAVNSVDLDTLVTLDNLIVQSYHQKSAVIWFSSQLPESEKAEKLNILSKYKSILVITNLDQQPWQANKLAEIGFSEVHYFEDPIRSVWIYQQAKQSP